MCLIEEFKNKNPCDNDQLVCKLGVSRSFLYQYLKAKRVGGDTSSFEVIEERLRLLLACEEAIQDRRISCTFDWVTIRFHCFSYGHALKIVDWMVQDVLKLDPSLFLEDDSGLYGYTKTISFEDIKIMIAPMEHIETLGVLMILSGGGCAQVYGLFQSRGLSFRDFLIRACDRPHTVTRLDIAVDDELKLLDLLEVFRKVEREEYHSSFRKINPVYTYRIEKDEDGNRVQNIKGISIYFGSRKSPFFMCWYEKDEEQKAKLGKAGDDLSGYGNRYELRFQDDKAKDLMVNYLQSDGNTSLLDLAMNRIQACICFYETAGLEKLWWNWSLFLQCATEVNFKQQKEYENEFIKKMNWLHYYVAKSWQSVLAVCQFNQDASFADMMKEIVLGRREVTFFRTYANQVISEEEACEVLQSMGYRVDLNDDEDEEGENQEYEKQE